MRPNHPWYWAAKNAWFVEIGNHRYQLGKHPESVPPPRKRKRGDPPPRSPQEIEQAHHRLMATTGCTLPEAETLKVCQVCDLFLDYSQKHHTAGTFRAYSDFLQDFCQMYSMLLGKDLKPLHVSWWLDAHLGWKSSRRNAVIAVKRVFNLGRRRGQPDQGGQEAAPEA